MSDSAPDFELPAYIAVSSSQLYGDSPTVLVFYDRHGLDF